MDENWRSSDRERHQVTRSRGQPSAGAVRGSLEPHSRGIQFPPWCRSPGRRLPRQEHLDPGSLARLAPDRHQAAVPVKDMLDDRKPQARPLLLAAGLGVDAIEAFGQARYVDGGYAHAVIDDRYGESVAGSIGYGHKLELDLAAAAAIFDSVVDEVLERFVELVAVASYIGRRLRGGNGYRYRFLGGPPEQPVRHFAQQHRKIHRGGRPNMLAHLDARKREKI